VFIKNLTNADRFVVKSLLTIYAIFWVILIYVTHPYTTEL